MDWLTQWGSRAQSEMQALAVQSPVGRAGAVGHYLLLPELRGLWAMSSVNESGNVLELSGQGRTLTNNNAAPRGIDADGIVPYVNLNGSNQYLSRADEAGLDVTGALTLGAWFYVDTLATGGLIGKWNSNTGNRGYLIYVLDATGVLRAAVSADGAAAVTVDSAAIGAATWKFVAMRFTPSAELALFVNADKTSNTTAIPAALFNSNSPFAVGMFTDAAGTARYLDGRAALAFMCAAALSDTVIDHLFRTSRGLFGV